MDQHSTSIKLSRRQFLLGTGSAVIGVSFGAGGLAAAGLAQAQQSGMAPNQWITIGTDGIVTIVSPASEMGQGTMTAMPLCVAEDLDADWSKVKVVQAGLDAKSYGNKLFGGAMATGASRTTRGYYESLRLAGAQARQVLLLAAADKWGVPAAELSTEPGVVKHAKSGRRMGYGEIAAFAQVPDKLPQVTPAMLKPIKDCRYIGKGVKRIDIQDKTTGRAKYGIDVRLDNMLYGAILRAPVQKDKPVSVDDSGAKAVKGYVKTVMLPYGVGVLAENTWAARQAKEALKVTWSGDSPAKTYDSEEVVKAYQAVANDLDASKIGVVAEKHGEARENIAKAAKVLKADVQAQHVAHMTMEPMNATARWTGDKLELWTPTQGPSIAAGALAAILKVQPANLTINTTLMGGGFGRRVEPDFSIDAALMAKEADGRPVKVTWTREDDVRHDKFRPLVAQHMEVGLDAQGNIVGWHHRLVGESIYARANPGLFASVGGKDSPFYEGAEISYGIHDKQIEFVRQQRGVDVSFWRAVGGGYTKMAIETMIDELAAERKMDPVQYRLQLLEKQPRAQAVIREAAKMAGWGKKRPAGRALGIAYSDMWETHVAEVAEVSVDKKTGAITVHNVWAAVDAGVAVLPQNVATQIEGGILFGISGALKEQVVFKNGEPQQSNFHDYPVLRMNEVPNVTVKVIQTDNPPGGVGESGLPPIAPAISNAVATLTGVRLRNLPMRPEAVQAALSA
ncbi:isoquinoline 1-oxidoreductase, beta subunit [Noviherbaspirillum humi]|uniref:Isoquinoline 1-oxidoreductase, beta subunit n=1 Tax=Noviherbaspirillum humi TaxID=1688639 RepID=A0A239ISY8_9BURK|nr:molybdopterin cofactor-binding domain-containing protein [Noviherbaspirillum humi]SNS96707.1 isoquinoline 1-oxidoreductase, beta subunit [Noviherbaspirillum humi]